jgi:hypothetical protein
MSNVILDFGKGNASQLWIFSAFNMVNNFKRVGFVVGLISVAAFANCNRIVLLIFFPITFSRVNTYHWQL